MVFITECELQFLRARYRNSNPDSMIQYALKCAEDYARLHAGDMLPIVRDNVAALHFRHFLHADIGDKQLIRIAIDANLAMGRAIRATATAQP